MTTISTITELLKLSGSQYRIYDVGRKIDKLSKEQFEKIENNQIPYPYPSQAHAFIAISFWQSNSEQPYLWFVKLPLDERGLLVQASRNHFIAIILEALGSDLSADPTQKQEELLKSNPYNFQPPQYKLAYLNSLINLDLKQAPSQYYEAVKNYFSSIENLKDWHNIGVQGIADFVVRLEDESHADHLALCFEVLPEQVLVPTCSALENKPLPLSLLNKIIEYVEQNEHTRLMGAVIRSFSSSCEHPHVKSFFAKLLAQNNVDEEVLIVIAGRCWKVLDDPMLMMSYLEQLVSLNDPEVFPSVFRDIVAIPALRPVVFQCMREPKRSEGLAKAIGMLFNQASKH